MRYREKQLQEEMIGCTFKPNLEGSLACARALERGGKSTTRSTNDMYIFHRQRANSHHNIKLFHYLNNNKKKNRFR